MKKLTLIFLLLITSFAFAQNNDKITYPRNTDELMNFMYQATLQGLRVIVIADSTTSGTPASSAKQDSIKNRIIELMAYQNSLKSKLDSLFNYVRADSLNTVQVDSVNNTKDSLVVNYTTWVKYSFSGDSTFVIDFDSLFTNPKVFAPGTGYTITLPIAGHNKIFMKKKSTYAGYMRRNLVAEGK